MNTNTARAYIISSLSDDQVQRLHAVEKREGYRMPPCWIHENFSTPEGGEVPEAAWSRVERVVMAIFLRAQDQYRAKNIESWIFDQVPVQHVADWEIRHQKVEFSSGSQGTNLRERIRSGRRQGDLAMAADGDESSS